MRTCRLFFIAILTAAMATASLPLPSSQTASAAIQEQPSATNWLASAVVIVNSASASHADFQHYVQPYLDHFGIPYDVLDISTTPVGLAVGNYAVIIVGHKQLDVSQTYLDATEQTNLVTAVNAGTGLVNFDNDLAVGGSMPRYPFITSLFGFGYVTPTAASDVTLSATPHYITTRHQASETLTTASMTMAGLTLPATATALVTSGAQPFLAVATSGTGRAVQWGTYDWMSSAVKGPMYGLDDLVWRSIVWAARKPFVMQGMPPFVTMRIDDVSGPMDWIHIANEVGIKPWAGIFLNNIDETEAADLAALSQAGSATVGIHAFTDPYSFYYNQYNGNWPDDVMAANYVTGTQWFVTHNITPSKYVAFHHYEVGTNAFAGLSNWGVQFVATHQLPGQPEYMGAEAWLQAGPYRLYESGQGTSTTPVYYADYLSISGHPEYNQQFFNCVTEVRDEQVYEWIPSNNVTASVYHGTRQLQRGLDGMAVPTLFAHQYNMTSITNDNWRAILQGITSNLASYQPMYVTMDYACQYARAMYTSKITASVFNSISRQITTTLSGKSDMPTKFYLFTDVFGQIQQQLIDVPAFNGSIEVIHQLPGGAHHLTVTPHSTTLTIGDTQQFVAQAYDVEGQLIPGLTYQWNVVNGGGSINAQGVFTAGLAYGIYSNTVTASLGALQGSASVTVWLPVGPRTLWDASIVPPFPNVSDGHSGEVGLRFYSDIDGYITGLRFYKGNLNTGTHIGNLWSITGTLLASVTFQNETASGWQTATFASPVRIVPNTRYIASYFSPSGYFAESEDYFITSWDRLPLHAPAGSPSEPNGVYQYSESSTFPASNGNYYNHWVDVIFNTNTGPLAIDVQHLAAHSTQNSAPIFSIVLVTLTLSGCGLIGWQISRKRHSSSNVKEI